MIHKYGDTEKYDSRIAIVNSFDMIWMYRSAIFFAFLVYALNIYALGLRARVIKQSGNFRYNMFIYKMAAEG